MSHLIDTSKCEVGISDAYKKTFKGKGRTIDERRELNRKFRNGYGRIDWNK